MKQHSIALVLLLFLSWWAVRPIFGPGFFPMHDDTQVGRVVTMGKALRNGQFPVRWVEDLGYGYGYPIFNFYGPLPYYVGGLLYALGLSGLTATKIMMALGIILPVLTMYATTVPLFGRISAIVAAIFYLYVPYHAVQIYVRGAVGEFWAFAFFPLILYGFISKSNIVGAIGLAGTILSHTLLGYASTLFVIFGLMFKKNRSLLLFFGLGLAAFFWLPALFEMRYTSVSGQISPTANYKDHFVCLSQLWNSPWGFGGSAPGCVDGLSLKLGKLHILAAVPSLMVRPFWWGFAITAVSLFLLLPASEFLWNIIPGFSFLQYPWRLLSFAGLGVSILVGAGVGRMKENFRFPLSIALLILVIGIEGKWFTPQFTYTKDEREFETQEELRWRVSKISDEYLPTAVHRPKTVSEVGGVALSPTGSLDVGTDIDKETYKKFSLLSKTAQTITIQRAYFPGWHYWVNGRETLEYLSYGFPVLSVPEGESVIEMRFTNTPIRTLANIVSLGTLVYLLYTYGKKNYA